MLKTHAVAPASVPPAAGVVAGLAEAVGEGEAAGLAEAVGDGEAAGLAEAVGDGDAAGLADAVGVGADAGPRSDGSKLHCAFRTTRIWFWSAAVPPELLLAVFVLLLLLLLFVFVFVFVLVANSLGQKTLP